VRDSHGAGEFVIRELDFEFRHAAGGVRAGVPRVHVAKILLAQLLAGWK